MIDYNTVSRGGGIGRRAGLKIRWAYAREGSSPSLGTTVNKGLRRPPVQPFVPSDNAWRFGSKAATFSRTAIAVAACFSRRCV